MMNNKLIKLLDNFLKLTEEDVFELFSRQKNAFVDGFERKKFVYIKGTREDRVLLVAHADTVWDKEIIKTKIENGIISSDQTTKDFKFTKNNRSSLGVGIGADDRAGIAILWCLKDLGHSILITSGEENGCVASKRLNSDPYWNKELNSHNYMLEFDRSDKNNIVFYDTGTKEFAKYLQNRTGFIPCTGGYGSDIKYIAEKICAANISVGYYNQHTASENIICKEWINTLTLFSSFLSEKQDKFELVKKNLWEKTYPNKSTYQHSLDHYKKNELVHTAHNKDCQIVYCTICSNGISETSLINNNFECPICAKKEQGHYGY